MDCMNLFVRLGVQGVSPLTKMKIHALYSRLLLFIYTLDSSRDINLRSLKRTGPYRSLGINSISENVAQSIGDQKCS